MLSKDKLNSRKLVVFLIALVTGTGLLVGRLLEADHWVTVCTVMGGAYMATQAYVDKGPKQ